ncbi:hypothetical protein [Coprothermobacter platensis]|uniref:hypothetical protein n=1 Tax=Coprothermobacter platensis TaxID=108819 RepID=UPI000376283E|nr:hypothetical protein [Coprothermobacter platensis]
MKGLADISALVASRQDLTVPLDTLKKLQTDPFWIRQIPLSNALKEQISGKSARRAMEVLWENFLSELDELSMYLEEDGYDIVKAFYEARFKGTEFDEELLRKMPFGNVLSELFIRSKNTKQTANESPVDWRVEWLKYLEQEYYSGSFLAGVLRYIELRFQTVAGLSLALLRTE